MRRVPKGGPQAEALGRSRGGFSTKIHLRCERSGKPIVVILTEGQRHEQPVLPTLIDRGAVKRPGRGRPRIRPDQVAGDKGYSSPTVRRCLKERRIKAVIPTKADVGQSRRSLQISAPGSVHGKSLASRSGST